MPQVSYISPQFIVEQFLVLSTMFMYGKEIRTTLPYGYYVNVYLLFFLE